MRYAILSDIHANLEALQAVLEDAKQQQVTHYACLGDIVGYNASPKECLKIVRSMEMVCVKGNHDEYCSSDAPLHFINERAAKAVTWTREQLGDDDRAWLRELKLVRVINGFTMVHASLDAPQRWSYIFDLQSAATSFAFQGTTLCFYGHTHIPAAFVRDSSEVCEGTYSKLKVESEAKYLINVGSVGQPRDYNTKAAYVIYDLDEETIELRRLDYDISTAQAKNRAAGL